MKEYFILQHQMACRKLKELGVNPILGLVLGLVFLFLISEYSFQKTPYAKYLIMLVALSYNFTFSDQRRSDFLLSVFGKNKKRKIRIIENLLISLPFVIVLLFKNHIYESIILLISSTILACLSFRNNHNLTLPTPFAKDPFEFTSGFRRSALIILLAYILLIIAINVDNKNLGIFALLLIHLVSLSYFIKPENQFFIWIYSCSPQAFIRKKLLNSAKNVLVLSSPILVGLSIFYWQYWASILLFFIIGLLIIWIIILAKYSAYPNQINLPQGVLIAISMYFPPVLIITIPLFYKKSIAQLRMILDDRN